MWSSSMIMVPSRAEQLDAVGLAERRIARRQRVAHAEIDHRAVGEGDDRPGHVVGAVAGLLEDAVLAARHHFDRPVALQEPAHQVDVIGEHVEHRRRVRVALEDGEGLGARIVDARGAADDPAEPAVQHLLLGAQEAFLVAAAVADAQIAFGLAQASPGSRRRRASEKPIGFSTSTGLPSCKRRAGSARVCSCSGVETITAVTSGMADHLVVVAGVEVGAGLLGQRARARRVAVGDREKAHRRMLGGEPRAQRPDAAGADHARCRYWFASFSCCP